MIKRSPGFKVEREVLYIFVLQRPRMGRRAQTSKPRVIHCSITWVFQKIYIYIFYIYKKNNCKDGSPIWVYLHPFRGLGNEGDVYHPIPNLDLLFINK